MDPVNGLDSSLIFLGMDHDGFNQFIPRQDSEYILNGH